MRLLRAMSLIGGLLCAGVVQAREMSKAGAAEPQAPADPRIRTIDYDPRSVVRVTGVFRTATQILFGDDETILHVAVGDSTGWDVAAEQNALFLKPKTQGPPTNLIATTRRGQATRHYSFELTAREARDAGRETVFVLHFRYPADQAEKAHAVIEAAQAALEARLVSLKLERAVVEGPRNVAYAVQGASALQPSEVSDNGRLTLMRFPANQPIPAIYQVESGGTEALVPFDVRGEFVVVHAVSRQLRLRRGREVLCIYNEAFDPYGRNTATGTAAADVIRTDKQGSAP